MVIHCLTFPSMTDHIYDSGISYSLGVYQVIQSRNIEAIQKYGVSSIQFFLSFGNFLYIFLLYRTHTFLLLLKFNFKYSILFLNRNFFPTKYYLNFLSQNYEIYNWEHHHSITSIYYFGIFPSRHSMISNKIL